MIGYFKRASRILIYGITVSFVFIFAGPIEGRIYPVAEDYTVLSESVEGNDLAITMTFEKQRSCEFVAVDWYVYFDENFKDKFTIETRFAHFSRPLGQFKVDWKIIGAGAWIGHKMEIVTDHHCWGPYLWITRTTSAIKRASP